MGPYASLAVASAEVWQTGRANPVNLSTPGWSSRPEEAGGLRSKDWSDQGANKEPTRLSR